MSGLLNLKIIPLMALGLLCLIGCGEVTDEDRIGDAQYCMDDIPVSEPDVAKRTAAVNSCMSKLGSVVSSKASLMRCSGNFLIEGFGNPEKIVSAMENVTSTSGGAGTVAMMNVLKFSSQGSNQANSDFVTQTLTYCQDAGSPGFVMIASFARIATSMASVASVNLSDGLSPTEVSAIMNESPAVIGATATVAYQTSCTEGESSNAELCDQLGAAIQGGMTEEQIGQALLTGWQSQ
jgi:hypothetical protein